MFDTLKRYLTGAPSANRLRKNDAGFMNLGPILAIVGAVLVVILGAIVVFSILGSTTGSLASSVKNTSTNVSTSDWGSTTANAIAPNFGLIISLVGLFIVVIGAAGVLYFQRHHGGNGGL